jgi:hypothetical protein
MSQHLTQSFVYLSRIALGAQGTPELTLYHRVGSVEVEALVVGSENLIGRKTRAATKMTPERRKEIACNTAKARWDKRRKEEESS